MYMSPRRTNGMVPKHTTTTSTTNQIEKWNRKLNIDLQDMYIYI